MICPTCRDFHRCFPGQTPPPHDCFFGDPVEQLHVLTHTTSELVLLDHALDRLANDMQSDDSLIAIVDLRRHLLDTLQGVEA